MWASFRLITIGTIVAAASFLLVAVASTLALARAQVESVDADLASVIRADYSADSHGERLAPLTEGIVDVARQDEDRLQETSASIEIVPVFRQPMSPAAERGAEPATTATPAANPGQAPPILQATPRQSTHLPGISPTGTPSGPAATRTATRTPTGTATRTPGTLPPESPVATVQPTPAPATPGPSPSVTVSPTATGTATPAPTVSPTGTQTPTPVPTAVPTASPVFTPTTSPSPTPVPTPSPSPSPTPPPQPADLTLYLHNNPTPPIGDTVSHHELLMDPFMPVALDLYNYDTDRDAFPGLLIAKGGSGANEADPAKHQHWRTPAFPAAVTIEGTATLKLWSATKDFDVTKGGVISVYLRDCVGASCVGLIGGTLSDPNWQGGSSSWMLKTLTLSVGTRTIAAGHSLELVVVVEASSAADMWFAYDTNNHNSRVTVTASSDVWPPLGSAPSPLLSSLVSSVSARWLFS